ncbi:MAG: 3'-5' exonuclease [Deltaproteobacteria bacterium]|nr:3'-5' exonuclease [Deltaproteobacteria bacterium]
MKYLVFDIETRIDKGLVRAVYHPDEPLSDEEAYERVRQHLRQEYDSDFFPVPFHVPICVVLGRVSDDLRLSAVDTYSVAELSEAEVVRRFWAEVEAMDAKLVSFNGRGFDLPVLELQALRHGVAAPRYFNERYGLRYRYSDQQYDLHDFLTNAGAVRLRGGLDMLSKLIGLPGKTTVRGEQVEALWGAGETQAISRYCRRDVIQTYLLLLRVERMRGRVSQAQLEALWAAAAAWRAEL